MVGVFAFAAVLLVAAAVSGLARRSILSTAVLFLAAGALLGNLGLEVLHLEPSDAPVEVLTEVALFTVLFTDGMRTGLTDLRWAWRLPGRVLLVGMPITFALTALLAHLIGSLPWTEAMLVAAALSPTDPVLASAIVGRHQVPARVRQVLNVESGLNDGLALPVVVVLLDVVAERPVDVATVSLALVGGVAIGIAVPLAAAALFRLVPDALTARYEALAPVAIGMLVYSGAHLSGANVFLAGFFGGMTVATVSPSLRRAFDQFGELTTELLKLAALLVFGALLTTTMFVDVGLRGLAFALLALTVVRLAAVAVALVRTGLHGKEFLTVAWFGPKGFASVVYALLILSSHVHDDDAMFGLIAVTVVVSIVAHSSTDALVAGWFESDSTMSRADYEALAEGRGQL
jgi:NhaP-type Na+/H+ or K+/H+ antiporter